MSTAHALTDHQVRFYRSFGFLKVPGLFADDVGRIEAAFDAVFEAEPEPFYLPSDNEFHETPDPAYADRLRQIIPGFLDKSPELAWLKDDPRVLGTVRSLLGDDIVYAESDGNLFNCDVYWHTDLYGADASKENLKLFFYLDSLRGDSGALRVLPGTHHHEGIYGQTIRSDLYTPAKALDRYGIDLEDFPSHTIDVEPGDLVVMNFRVLHGSWHGAPGRKLFTVNYTQTST
ncbi:MAG: phytanoyl-CoA dioxygenase family protein [Acidimicrobiia bacterium]|nr:phytanoyl-CoA dioxygenase family protein [Acidimicrobiia bacterium]